MIRSFRTAFGAVVAALAFALPAIAQDGVSAPRALTATAICNALGRCPATLPVDGTQITGLQLDTLTTLRAWTGRPPVVIVAGFAAANDGGGGTFVWAAGDSSAVDGCTVVQPVSGGAAGRYKRIYSGAIDAHWCGTKGDGTTDDGAALALAIAAAPAGGTVYLAPVAGCYKITSPLVIARALTLQGRNSAICQTRDATVGLSISASNVQIDGLVLTGPGSSAMNDPSRAIQISGTFNSGSPPTYISDVSVTNTVISQWNAYGIYAAYVDRLTVSHNTFRNIVYSGISVISGTNGKIAYNTIDTINGNSTPGGNAYGIALSRLQLDGGELVSQPRTSNFSVYGNVVRNVPTWEGIDTHCGQQIAITGNTVQNTYYGIAAGPCQNALSVQAYAPLQVTISGNNVDSGVTDGSRENGIHLIGVSSSARATGAIVGNSIKGSGSQTNGISGGIVIEDTAGVPVVGNTIVNAAPTGITVYTDNVGFTVSGNSIVDPWTNSGGVGEAVGVRLASNSNTGTITGNSFSTNGLSATYLLTSAGTGIGVRVDSAGGNAVELGRNQSAAAIYLYDPGGAVTSLGVAFGGTNANLSATGGASQVLKQTSTGAPVTVGQLACSDLSNAGPGCSASTGTSGAAIPLLNGANTWSATQAFAAITATTVTASSSVYAGAGASLGFTSRGALTAASDGSWTLFKNDGTTKGNLTLGQLTTTSTIGVNGDGTSTGILIGADQSTPIRLYHNGTDTLRVAGDNAGLTVFFVADNNGTNNRRTVLTSNSTSGGLYTDWSAGAIPLGLGVGGAFQWQISTSGHLVAVTDAAYDIGQAGANRPRHIYASSDVTAPASYVTPAAAPSSPATAGAWVIYSDSSDGNKLKGKASTGTVVTLGTP
jgi:hypothetical protein